MKFLLFDFDGVIVDTFTSGFEIMKRMKGGPLTEQEYRDWFNEDVYKKFDGVEAHPGDRVEEVTPFFQAFIPKVLQAHPVEGMVGLIQKLHAVGYRMVIISSTMDTAIRQFLELHGISDCFDAIYGASVGKNKTEKMNNVLRDMGLQAQDALFITDTLGDLRDAQSVGIPAIAVAWGYHPITTLEKGSSIAIVQNSTELEQIILKASG